MPTDDPLGVGSNTYHEIMKRKSDQRLADRMKMVEEIVDKLRQLENPEDRHQVIRVVAMWCNVPT